MEGDEKEMEKTKDRTASGITGEGEEEEKKNIKSEENISLISRDGEKRDANKGGKIPLGFRLETSSATPIDLERSPSSPCLTFCLAREWVESLRFARMQRQPQEDLIKNHKLKLCDVDVSLVAEPLIIHISSQEWKQ